MGVAASEPPRIASLVPSVTELVCALGLGARLVARTGFCIHPAAELSAVPKVGGTKDVNLDKLRRLAPTHVLVNVDENRLDTVAALRDFVPEVLVTHPCAPHDNLGLLVQMVEAFGAEPGVRERAGRLKAELESELAVCRATRWPGRQVLYLIWRDPWMTVARDTYISRMLAQVGWQTWPAVDGGPCGAARYPVVIPQSPWLADVGLVLLSSEPYRFDAAHLDEAHRLVPGAQAQLVDGELLSWYGPRAAAGLAYLRRLAGDLAGDA
jgi:ABC-type Fe3+-hydroxamate transport system substrate-binding protein